jgi:hypothetical protein
VFTHVRWRAAKIAQFSIDRCVRMGHGIAVDGKDILASLVGALSGVIVELVVWGVRLRYGKVLERLLAKGGPTSEEQPISSRKPAAAVLVSGEASQRSAAKRRSPRRGRRKSKPRKAKRQCR